MMIGNRAMKKTSLVQKLKLTSIFFLLLALATACPSASDKTFDEARVALDTGQ